jgi:hypothetical protein
MHFNTYLFLLLISCTFSIHGLAQDSTGLQVLFGDGLTIQGGIGYLSIRDEYISPERYSGTIPCFAVNWSKLHETYGYRLLLEYGHTSDLKNYDVSTEVTQFLLGLGFLYPIGKTRLFSREIDFFLGPTEELFMYMRHQGYSAYSEINAYAGLFSGGVRSEAFCFVVPRLQLRAALQTTLLSLGMKSTREPSGSKTTSTKLLTPFGGFRLSGELQVVHRLGESLSAAVGYHFEMATISAWDFSITAEDEIIASISVDF